MEFWKKISSKQALKLIMMSSLASFIWIHLPMYYFRV